MAIVQQEKSLLDDGAGSLVAHQTSRLEPTQSDLNPAAVLPEYLLHIANSCPE